MRKLIIIACLAAVSQAQARSHEDSSFCQSIRRYATTTMLLRQMRETLEADRISLQLAFERTQMRENTRAALTEILLSAYAKPLQPESQRIQTVDYFADYWELACYRNPAKFY